MTEHTGPRVTVIQPVVASYRKGFFDATAQILGDRFTVYASDLDMGVLTENAPTESWRKSLGPIKQLLPGAEWQVGAMSTPIARGDVVVVPGAPRCLSNMLLLVRARMLGARIIWWGQLWSGTSRWYRFILRLVLMRLAHAILFYTDAEVADYKARHGRNDHRPLSALNNGIDVKPIQSVRAPYDAAARDNAILFVGRITEKAQIALLLQAMTRPELARATLHVIGDGPDASALQRWTQENGLKGRVVWHGGTVDEARIAAVANQVSVFCYPGGVGLSLIHAMAYGLPTVVHDDRQTHMPEIAAFEDGVTGAQFKKDDTQSLAEALANLLSGTEARARMSTEALRRADTMYNTDAMAERLVEFVNQVASGQ